MGPKGRKKCPQNRCSANTALEARLHSCVEMPQVAKRLFFAAPYNDSSHVPLHWLPLTKSSNTQIHVGVVHFRPCFPPPPPLPAPTENTPANTKLAFVGTTSNPTASPLHLKYCLTISGLSPLSKFVRVRPSAALDY